MAPRHPLHLPHHSRLHPHHRHRTMVQLQQSQQVQEDLEQVLVGARRYICHLCRDGDDCAGGVGMLENACAQSLLQLLVQDLERLPLSSHR